MDLNLPLLLLAVLSALVLGVRSVVSKPRAWGWFGACATILIVAVAGALLAFPIAGLLAFASWTALVLGPILLSRLQARALLGQHYRLASVSMHLLVVLHPSRGHRAGAARLRALVASSRGDIERAAHALDRYAAFGPAQRAEALIEKARLRPDGAAIREAVAAADAAERGGPGLALGVVRALAEIGDRNAAIARFRIAERLFEGDALEQLRTSVYLVLFAESGRAREVEAILGARLRAASSEVKSLWRAIAKYAGGDPTAHAELTALATSSDGVLRRAAKVRLDNPRDLEPLPQHDDELLDRLALRLAHEDRYRYGSTLAGRAWATHAIAAVLLAVLALEEAVGGSTERDVLEKLGALSVDRVLYDGELWRLVAPLFLHYGVAHAVFNLLGLYVLGPFVERALGWQRFVVVYLLSGLAGTGLYVVRARLFSPDEPLPLLVGASGCVMGLLGATVAILARGALRERAPSARRRLVVLGAVLVVQTIFDLSVENISAFAHLVGALAGLVLGLLLTAGARRS